MTSVTRFGPPSGGIPRSEPDRPDLHVVPLRHPGVDEMRSERRQAGAERYVAIDRPRTDGMPPHRIVRDVGMGQRTVER